ncbi:Band 5 [Paramuricea clavata]|uniref:Band 5 n=2 Tax=Paramuricea clavata TaxID=317549 RepID=A0A6S7G257_PARCT|nr:Band 5 [Paramuricea clavata]
MSLIRRLSRRFSRRGSRPSRRRQDYSDGKCHDKDSIACKVDLLDGTVLSFNLEKKSIGEELINLVDRNLDLIEKEYFGLQFTDSLQVSHWLDPLKRIKKQIRGQPPYTLNFRVKFYAAEPHSLSEELTRYHFFLQLKQDILAKRLNVPLKKLVELAAYSLQSELGDFDPELHEHNYISDFKFIPEQTAELEKEIHRKHRQFAGLNPADCEVNFLKIMRSVESYGMHQYEVMGDKNRNKYHLGLSHKGIIVIKDNAHVATHAWPRIMSLSFKRNHFNIVVEKTENPSVHEPFSFTLASAKASKQMWKAAVESHSFFRLLKTGETPVSTASFFRRGSKFRFSGRTQHQVNSEAKKSARKQMKIERTKSERYSKRSTVGYIRVGSKVWAKALNGDYYKGAVTGLGEKVHIKFNNEDTIAHERDADDCVVFDMDPNPEDIQINTRVIAHWSSISAYLSGTVIKIEGQKYYVHYDDGDKGWNSIRQLRILKPPTYFGPGAKLRARIKKVESFKETSMMARPITMEKPLKAKERRRLENNGETKAPSHAPPPPPNSGNHNERKVSSSKSSDGHNEQRNNSAPRHHSASAAERRTALDKLLNSADVATDVDTGQAVFVHDEERYRNKHATAPPSMRNQRPSQEKSSISSDQRDYYSSRRPGPPMTEL